jgi:hypothetical protein
MGICMGGLQPKSYVVFYYLSEKRRRGVVAGDVSCRKLLVDAKQWKQSGELALELPVERVAVALTEDTAAWSRLGRIPTVTGERSWSVLLFSRRG